MNNLITTRYRCDGGSVNVDALGMREMQRRVYAKWDSQYLLLKAPPASGKSRALMYVALEKLGRNRVKKVVVAVPERSIAKSFAPTELKRSGFHSDWTIEPKNDLCQARGSVLRTAAFEEFMDSDDRVLLCTHSTLRFAFEKLGPQAFADCLVAIDEFHHVSADVESRLGELLRVIMRDTNNHILAMTGSYFRGDCAPILAPSEEQKFTKVTYNYYEQLNGYQHLKSLGIGFHFYRGKYLDAIGRVLDPGKHTIVHIPSVNSSESTKEKLGEVDAIIETLGKYVSTDEHRIVHVETPGGKKLKVADLVTDEASERDKVIGYLRNISKEDDVDVIIALGMAKEGFDWPFCETTLTVGYRGSLTEIIQIIGRCTRDSPNKTHAQFTNLIAEPDAERDDIVDSVNNMLKAIAASLLMEEVIAPKFSFSVADRGAEDLERITITGFKAPTSERVRDIIRNEITELKARVIQSPDIQASFTGTIDPEVINKALIPKVIQEVYPDLNEQEAAELGDHVTASFGLSNSNVVTRGNDRFIRFSNRLVNVAELDIDLIRTINPFKNAFDVMSKALSPRVFQAVQQCIRAMRIRITDDEAIVLWPKINDFVRAKRREPSLDSIDPLERRMAEALVYVKQLKRERKS